MMVDNQSSCIVGGAGSPCVCEYCGASCDSPECLNRHYLGCSFLAEHDNIGEFGRRSKGWSK